MAQENRPAEQSRKPYQRPEVARVQVDPVKDLLSHGLKANEFQLGCGTDPAHHSPS